MAAPERYSAYDGLAWIYNRYWGREYPRLVMPILAKLLLTLFPAGASVLDTATMTR